MEWSSLVERNDILEVNVSNPKLCGIIHHSGIFLGIKLLDSSTLELYDLEAMHHQLLKSYSKGSKINLHMQDLHISCWYYRHTCS